MHKKHTEEMVTSRRWTSADHNQGSRIFNMTAKGVIDKLDFTTEYTVQVHLNGGQVNMA